MNYDNIMDTHVSAIIKKEILAHANLDVQTPCRDTYTHYLANCAIPPPQDWILQLKPRLDQQIRLFLSIINNTSFETEYNMDKETDMESLPSVIKSCIQYLDIYRELFQPLKQYAQQKLIYRVAKFLLTCNGFIWMLADEIDITNPDNVTIDTDPKWLFFIALSYAIIDYHVDTNYQTHQLFTYLDILFNSKPSDNCFDTIPQSWQYLSKLYYQFITPDPMRIRAAKRALDCERYTYYIQTTMNTRICPIIATELLIEKSISTIRLIYTPHRAAKLQIWQKLYWAATCIQLLDDAVDATEDTLAGLSGTTGLAICNGIYDKYISIVLNIVSYVYYDIFAGQNKRLALLHQIALYGIIKNMGSSIKSLTQRLTPEYVSRYVTPQLALSIESLYSIRASKPELRNWLTNILYNS